MATISGWRLFSALGLLQLLLLGPVLAVPKTMPPDEALLPLRKICATLKVEQRAKQTWQAMAQNVRQNCAGITDDDVTFMVSDLEHIDYESEFLELWATTFTPQEWARVNTYLDEIGLKELASIRSIVDDTSELNKGMEYVKSRKELFYAGLTKEEFKKAKAFQDSPLAPRYWELMKRTEIETPEAMARKFMVVFYKVQHRLSARNENEHDLMVAAAVAITQRDSSGDLVYDTADVQRPPLCKSYAPTIYPHELLGSGLKANATVVFIVNQKGGIEKAAVVQTTDHRFDQSSLDTIKGYQYRAAKKDGEAVSCRVYQQLLFFPEE